MSRFLSSAVAGGIILASAASLRAQATPQHETDNRIRFFQWKVAQDPDDCFNYDRLGVAYIQKGRETGDITYYGLAATALEKSLALESKAPEAAPAAAHLAAVYYAEHRFAEALALGQKALELNPRDITPNALIGDAQSEMGDYDKAWVSYARLNDEMGPLAAMSGVAYLAQSRASVKSFLTGQSQASIEHMRKAVSTAMDSAMPAESVAWSEFSLGEACLQVGDMAGARSAYEDALKAYPEYHRALAGLGKVSAAEGKLPEAIDLYKRAIAVIPLPLYAAALGDVYAKAGNAAEAKKEYDLVEYIARLNAFNQSVYNRELAMFYADHDRNLAKAVALARKEFEVRHDIYTWDALAWTLDRNGEYAEAATAMRKALRLGTQDPLILFHAGMIARDTGENAQAEDFLHRALALNPQFHLFYADAARATLRDLAKTSPAAATVGAVDAHP